MTLLIIDCGIGNIGSIANMLNRLGVAAEVVGTRQELRRASRIVLPGVGSFNNGMRALHDRDLVEPLTERVLGDGVPVLGICLGLELMTRASEEGSTAGLGWLAADTRRFCLPPEAARLKVPHMGWNEIVCTAPALLTAGFAPAERFYFAHSYHVQCDHPADVVALATYGYAFPAIVGRGNVWGVQFHPEKSHAHGMRLLANFATRC